MNLNYKKMKKFILILIAVFVAGFSGYAQDECSNAPVLEITQYSTCGEMVLESVDLGSASPSTTTPAPTCGGFNSGSTNDLWYSFYVPEGAYAWICRLKDISGVERVFSGVVHVIR